MARKPTTTGGGSYQIGDPKGKPQGRSPASTAKAIKRAGRKIARALDPGPSITIKRGTKDE
jgi:hypothetical protein